MKKWILGLASLLLSYQLVFANDVTPLTGLFFNTTSTGTTLTINTLVPNHPDPYTRAGIQLRTRGYTLANPLAECTSYNARTGMCIFTVSNTVPKVISIAGPAGTADVKLCLNGVGELTCQHYTHRHPQLLTGRFLYVASSGNGGGTDFIVICDLHDNGATFGNCRTSPSTTFDSTQSIVFHPNGSMLYVANFGNGTVSSCAVNLLTGNLGTCTSSSQLVDFGAGEHSLLGTVGVDPVAAFVYVPDYKNSRVLGCATTGGVVSTCAFNTVVASFPNSVTINPAGTLAYVVEPTTNTIEYCTFAGGTLAGCASVGQLFNGPLSVSFNVDGTFAYVANGTDSSVYSCPVLVGGAFGGCTPITNQGFNFGSSAEGPVSNLFMTTGLNFGYVPNAQFDTVSICTITPPGTLSNCSQLGSQFSPYFFITPTGVTVSPLVA
jgi:DNA-binding beta-propeller fold protein YncE